MRAESTSPDHSATHENQHDLHAMQSQPVNRIQPRRHRTITTAGRLFKQPFSCPPSPSPCGAWYLPVRVIFSASCPGSGQVKAKCLRLSLLSPGVCVCLVLRTTRSEPPSAAQSEDPTTDGADSRSSSLLTCKQANYA